MNMCLFAIQTVCVSTCIENSLTDVIFSEDGNISENQYEKPEFDEPLQRRLFSKYMYVSNLQFIFKSELFEGHFIKYALNFKHSSNFVCVNTFFVYYSKFFI